MSAHDSTWDHLCFLEEDGSVSEHDLMPQNMAFRMNINFGHDYMQTFVSDMPRAVETCSLKRIKGQGVAKKRTFIK